MRLLKLNGQTVELDSKTAIGITFQAYDFKEPGKRKVKISNSFTIPLTWNNRQIIGFADDVQVDSQLLYGSFSCDYWLENEQIITNATVRIDEIDLGNNQNLGRVKLFVTEKNSIWDDLKSFTYAAFLEEYSDWLKNEENEYIFGYDGSPNYFSGTWTEFIENYTEGVNLFVPMLYSNFFNYEPNGEGTGFLEDDQNIYLTYGGSYGGHVCTFMKSIFKFLEYKYNVDFLLNSTDPAILWNDEFAPNIYIHLRDCRPITSGANPNNTWAWDLTRLGDNPPYENAFQSKDKTIYDLVNSYMQLFNVIIDESLEGETTTIKMYRFDDIETKAPIVDFSGKFDLSKVKFKPKIGDYKQNNRIKYTSVYPEGLETEGMKTIICKNKNLDLEGDLFDIDAYYPNVVEGLNNNFINLSTEESFSAWTFLINDAANSGFYLQKVNIHAETDIMNTAFVRVKLAAIYGISGEYKFIEKILEYPKSYEVEKWLSVSDVIGLKFFAQYFIRELNGSFFVNTIKGFNPTNSNNPTKIELIRISDRVPYPLGEFKEEAWTDGTGDSWTDGNGEEFTYINF